MSRAVLRTLIEQGSEAMMEPHLRHLMQSRGGRITRATRRSSGLLAGGALARGGRRGGSVGDDLTWLWVLLAIIGVLVLLCAAYAIFKTMKAKRRAQTHADDAKLPSAPSYEQNITSRAPAPLHNPINVHPFSVKAESFSEPNAHMPYSQSQPQPSNVPANGHACSILAFPVTQDAADLNPYALYQPGSAPSAQPAVAPVAPLCGQYPAPNATEPGCNAPVV